MKMSPSWVNARAARASGIVSGHGFSRADGGQQNDGFSRRGGQSGAEAPFSVHLRCPAKNMGHVRPQEGRAPDCNFAVLNPW